MLSALWQRMGSLQTAVGSVPRFVCVGRDADLSLSCTARIGSLQKLLQCEVPEVLCTCWGCWVLMLSPVMSPFDVLRLLPVTDQTGHGVARLPGDAQTGAADPVPPQLPACTLLLAPHAGLSSSSSSDAASINSELEVSACSWLFRCFFSPGTLPCCSVYVKASTPYGDSSGFGDRSRALFGQVHPRAMPWMLLRRAGCSAEQEEGGDWLGLPRCTTWMGEPPQHLCIPSQPHLPALGVTVHGRS